MDHIVKVTALSTPPQHLQIKNQRLVLKWHTQSHQTLLDFAYLIFLRIQQQPRLLPTSTNLTLLSPNQTVPTPIMAQECHPVAIRSNLKARCVKEFDVAIHDSTHRSFQLPHLS